MDLDASYIVQHLRSIVIHSLDTFNLKNAEFAAERLVALAPEDPDSVYLYALTLYRQGKYKTAFNRSSEAFSNGAGHVGCAYIYARSCLHLSKHKEGIYRLTSVAHLYNDSSRLSGDGAPAAGPNSTGTNGANTGATGVNGATNTVFDEPLFARLGARTNTPNSAPSGHSPMAEFHSPQARHNYEFARSVYPDSSAIYHLLGALYKAQGDTKNSVLNFQQALRHNAYDFEAFQELARAGADVSVKQTYQARDHESRDREREPPSFFPRFADHKEEPGVPNPFAATPRAKPAVEITTPQVASTGVPDAPLRRTHGPEEALHGPLAPLPWLGENKTPTAAHRAFPYAKRREMGDVVRGPKRSASGLLVPSRAGSKDVVAADAHLRQLYGVFARSFRALSKYDCYKAIRTLEALPAHEQNTPWVLAALGRLHYEIVNYKQSKRYFVRLRQQDRTRLEDMEYYSTLLWHLHQKVELTYLANELHDIDAGSPITWCVMGNLFSLTREADEAIRCFNKALAIDPKFTYAYTLRGHEYFSNDNYEKALECFRYSVLLDPRHYNAFYGIGMVYINLGEYQKADYHFKKAVAINPINIILVCCVGMVLEKLGKKTLALRQYELAHKLQPLSALPIFKKAQLLFAMQQFPQALEQFELVKDLAPNEASVHFLLGQLYNIQKDKYSAIREFTIALNLDPKGNYLIREAMETLKDQ